MLAIGLLSAISACAAESGTAPISGDVPEAKGWRTEAKSFEEVASFYRETLEGMMATPYMIGWHHCGCLEQWDPAERGDSPMNENGFMDPFENYHSEWTDVIQEVNSKAANLHEAAK